MPYVTPVPSTTPGAWWHVILSVNKPAGPQGQRSRSWEPGAGAAVPKEPVCPRRQPATWAESEFRGLAEYFGAPPPAGFLWVLAGMSPSFPAGPAGFGLHRCPGATPGSPVAGVTRRLPTEPSVPAAQTRLEARPWGWPVRRPVTARPRAWVPAGSPHTGAQSGLSGGLRAAPCPRGVSALGDSVSWKGPRAGVCPSAPAGSPGRAAGTLLVTVTVVTAPQRGHVTPARRPVTEAEIPSAGDPLPSRLPGDVPAAAPSNATWRRAVWRREDPVTTSVARAMAHEQAVSLSCVPGVPPGLTNAGKWR